MRYTNSRTRLVNLTATLNPNFKKRRLQAAINVQQVTSDFIDVSEWWLGSRVVSVLDSGAEGSGFKSQSRRCRVTVLGKLFTPIVSLFTKQQNW